ncbi:hypothetical protein [Listeria fleischmannii]|jgi:exopolyphosphatase/pppGpp-phosphohydrolase|uniref:hypothetical protein n=1 Tax=Listeria fleischmannii TaxID=1069827 RepID=UPI001626329A|nr:hypothetical protein [Listeria fleischmannii]MBC1418914.1 hypothetical protein [Listeria fleischmannii]
MKIEERKLLALILSEHHLKLKWNEIKDFNETEKEQIREIILDYFIKYGLMRKMMLLNLVVT